jgi:PKD repeat protein
MIATMNVDYSPGNFAISASAYNRVSFTSGGHDVGVSPHNHALAWILNLPHPFPTTEEGSSFLIQRTDTFTISTDFRQFHFQLFAYADAITHYYSVNHPVIISTVPYDLAGTGIQFEADQPPVASFTYSPENPVVSEPMNFDGTSSYDPDGEIAGHSWDFGDGNSGSGKVVTHEYCESGNYSVTLTVTDNGGLTDSASMLINVSEALEITEYMVILEYTVDSNEQEYYGQLVMASVCHSRGSDQIESFVAVDPTGKELPLGEIDVNQDCWNSMWGEGGLPSAPAFGTYTVTATDVDGNIAEVISWPTDHISNRVPTITEPVNNSYIATNVPTFSWEPFSANTDGYLLEVLGPPEEWLPGDDVVWRIGLPPTQTAIEFNSDGTAAVDELTPGNAYGLAVFAFEDTCSGIQCYRDTSLRIISFTICPSCALNPYAYSFKNRGVREDNPDTTADEGLTEASKWDIFRNTFDLTGVDSETQKQWVRHLSFGVGGNCYGMAVSSLMEHEYPDYDTFLPYPGKNYVSELDEPTRSNDNWDASGNITEKRTLKHIIEFQISQVGIPRDRKVTGTENVLNKLRNEFPEEMYKLGIYDKGSGHSLVPLCFATIIEDQEYEVTVYDPNHSPFDPNYADRTLIIKKNQFGKWYWEYDRGGVIWSGPSWLGASGDTSIDLTPISVAYNGGNRLRLPGTDDATEATVFLSGEANLFLTNSAGDMTGFKDDLFVEDIPNIRLVFPLGTLPGEAPERWQPAFYISNDTDLEFTIEGIDGNDEELSLLKFGKGYFVEFSASVSEEATRVDISDDGTGISITGQENEYSLFLNRNIDGISQTLSAIGISTTAEATHQYAIDWEALFEGEEGVTIKIDSDGDGDFDETIITGQPNTPGSPSPVSHATGVSINANLSWTGGDSDTGDSVIYDVYFGTSATPPLKDTIGPYSATQSLITYDPGTLVDGRTYYWQIVARDNHRIAREGPLWEFTVGSSGPTETWNLPYGLDADPASVNIWTYPEDAVTVTLADVDTTMPDGLLIWYYAGPVDGWLFYKKGWGAVNILETLTPGEGYIGIVPTASVWKIPQGVSAT